VKNLSASVFLIASAAFGLMATAKQQSRAAVSTNIPYSDARAILQQLREDLWPAELKAKTPVELEMLWPEWVSRRDMTIRARVAEGDEDSIIYFLLFGTTFTTRPRATERELAALVVQPAEALSSLRPRIEDFVSAVAAPGPNERLQFARQVIDRKGIDPTTEAGKNRMRRYLEERTASVGGAVRSSKLLDPGAELSDKLTLFRDRGLSSDTSIFIDFGIEQALEAIKAKGLLHASAVRRVAIVGPGLDFTDKQEGYDFYPPQTIQPFAVIDSLIRLGLSKPTELQVTAFDLSPRVIQHLEAARARARAGSPYTLVSPRSIDRPWTPNLVKYWARFGERIGEQTKAARPPPGAGRVEVRSVLVRPAVVLSTIPRDLNIVLQRFEPQSAADQFDLILATNILIYYDVFEQSLAAANVAKMLRAGGFFLSNNRIFELPTTPVSSVGYTDVTYMELPGIGEVGDQIVWYQR
jgi:hypothetical protein